MAATTEVIVIPDSSPERIWASSGSPSSSQRLSPSGFRLQSSPSSPTRSYNDSASGKAARRAKTPLGEEIGKENIPVVSQQKGLKAATEESICYANPQKPAQRKKSGKAQPKKAAKETGDQNKVLKGKVVKSAAARSNEAKNTQMDKEIRGPDEGTGQLQNLQDQGLNLEEALARRRDWTPPRSTTPIEIPDTEDEEDEKQLERKDIGDFLSSFRYTNGRVFSEESENSQKNKGHPPTKRRRIELVDYHVPDPKNFKKPPPRPTNDKADVKSKTKTITGLVTGRYATDAEATMASIGKFFDLEENPASAAENQPKKVTRRKTSKKKSESEYIILSPEAVTESLREQEFLFGTCSQLESGDSPTFLRETQKALLASENNAAGKVSPARPSSLASRFTGSKSLWSAASRDADGSTLQPEVLDLTDSPDFSSLGPNTKDRSRDEPESPTIGRQKASVRPEPVELGITEAGTSREVPPPSSNQSTQSKRNTNKSSASATEMPRYRGYTNAELSKLVASYGLKPIKSRKKMIEVLEQCWRSLHPEATRPESPAASQKPEREKASKAPRQPKTRKKNSQRLQQEVKQPRDPDPAPPTRSIPDEIEDSEEELIPSPTRMQRTRMLSHGATPAVPFSLPLTRSTTTVPETQRKRKDADDNGKPSLLTQITRAIHAQWIPCSNSSSATSRPLTWHEKILLYDPIVLEDLTSWLNTEGLDIVNEDRQVSIAEVREWCEMRGICCCSRR